MNQLPLPCFFETSVPNRLGFPIRSLFLFVWILLLAVEILSPVPLQARDQTDLGKTGWTLWLDRTAAWKADPLYIPPVNPATLPVNPPSCGWSALFSTVVPESQASQAVGTATSNPTNSLSVEVPGTVEQFLWDALSGSGKGFGQSGNYVGVSWWGKTFTVPATASGQRVKLVFTEGIRQRAEIFVNQQLVGYELAHQLPFEVDVTDAVQYGASNKLAVRVTDHGGNFSWGDGADVWGTVGTTGSPSGYLFPMSHSFTGVLGAVQLKTVNPVYVSDVFVKNKPTLTDIDADLEIANEGTVAMTGTVTVAIVEAWKHNAAVTNPQTIYTSSARSFVVQPSQTGTVSLSASAPQALLWDIKDANLYNLVTTVRNSTGAIIDQHTQRFGFRFLSVDGYGTTTRILLNNNRKFLLSSISWGFWPGNGIFPTPELARKHITSAQALGQNMLNFHRCMGNTMVLDLADEMGMLYYEEPGAYQGGWLKAGDPRLTTLANLTISPQLCRQRLLRMVKRDRNHPSLVKYNLINEPGYIPNDQIKADMAAAHLLDPTRHIGFGSGGMSPEADQPQKLHMLPYDQVQRTTGFCDIHNAGNSTGVYIDSIYFSPTNFLRNTRDPKEILIWGEEAALASPPQLELIQSNITQAGRNGWDGADYKDWFNAYNNYITGKGLSRFFPSISNLITSLGNIMYYEHGRFLENIRIADDADICVLNGYEDMKLDNFSGAVDVYRNLKGDPTLISQYMKPLYVAVKAPDKLGNVGDINVIDLFVINQQSIPAGAYVLKATVQRPDGSTAPLYTGTVSISGGDKYSDLVAQDIPVPLNKGSGYYNIKAELNNLSGTKLADGHDEILAVDWRSDKLAGKGAILSGGPDLMNFVKGVKGANVVAYSNTLGKVDYILAGKIDQGTTFNTISPFQFKTQDGESYGLDLEYYTGKAFNQLIDQRVSLAPIDFDTSGKLIPGYDILGPTNFSLRWQGYLIPQYSGTTQFQVTQDDGVRIWLSGTQVVNAWADGVARTETFTANLVAGQAYPIKIEAYQSGSGWQFALKWMVPAPPMSVDMAAMMTRVQQDGTKLLLVEDAENWAKQLKTLGALPSFSVFHPAKTWVGSNFFVRKHPFFQDLPANGGMNWEYQRLVMYDGPKHFGLYNMIGDQPVVSLVGGGSKLVSTAVGVVPYGNGKIVFSELDLTPNLAQDIGAASVPKKILCNYLKWAGAQLPLGKTVSLQSKANKLWVCADNTGVAPLIANRATPGNWESFAVVDLSSTYGYGYIALQAQANGRYVSASASNPLIADSSAIGDWQVFSWYDQGDGTIALRSYGNEKWVCAESTGTKPLIANRLVVGPWETFTLKIW